MTNNVSHFAIHVDDVDRAIAFYKAVFGWRFEPWGPPGFYQVFEAGLPGALHKRMEPLTGAGLRAFEITVGVDDVYATLAAVEKAGGKIVSPPFKIPTVGEVIGIEDTEGNHLSAMKYEAG